MKLKTDPVNILIQFIPSLDHDKATSLYGVLNRTPDKFDSGHVQEALALLGKNVSDSTSEKILDLCTSLITNSRVVTHLEVAVVLDLVKIYHKEIHIKRLLLTVDDFNRTGEVDPVLIRTVIRQMFDHHKKIKILNTITHGGVDFARALLN